MNQYWLVHSPFLTSNVLSVLFSYNMRTNTFKLQACYTDHPRALKILDPNITWVNGVLLGEATKPKFVEDVLLSSQVLILTDTTIILLKTSVEPLHWIRTLKRPFYRCHISEFSISFFYCFHPLTFPPVCHFFICFWFSFFLFSLFFMSPHQR